MSLTWARSSMTFRPTSSGVPTVSPPRQGAGPPARIALAEPHATADEPRGKQAPGPELDRPRVVQAVQLGGRFGLAGEVHRLGRRTLHPVGQLVGGDPAREFGIL